MANVPLRSCADIRRARLAELIGELTPPTQAQFSLLLGNSPKQTSAWLRAPGKDGAKNMRDRTCRNIERHFGKPANWMDNECARLTARKESEMVLQELKIEIAKWGPDRGAYKGEATFSGETGSVTLNLNKHHLDEIFRTCADSIVDTAKAAARHLTMAVVDQQAALKKESQKCLP